MHKRNSQINFFYIILLKILSLLSFHFFFQNKVFWWISSLRLIRYAFRWLKHFKHVLEVNESSTTKLENGLFSLSSSFPFLRFVWNWFMINIKANGNRRNNKLSIHMVRYVSTLLCTHFDSHTAQIIHLYFSFWCKCSKPNNNNKKKKTSFSLTKQQKTK